MLEQWVIYQSPADYPSVPYVVRGWIVGPGGQLAASGAVGFADTLDQARHIIPAGLVCLPRSPEDDAVIVETWF